jgi:antitoxin component of MazEF toxin-antitoxin module
MHVLEGTVQRWGGSLALRIDAKEAKRLGLTVGRKVHWTLLEDDEIDLGGLRTFTDLPDAAEKHDKLLHGE